MKKGSVVAAGSLVREGQEIDPYQMVAGLPAVVKKQLDASSSEFFQQPAKNYLSHSAGHRGIEILKE